MLLQASMNTFKKWYAEVVEILKSFIWISGGIYRKKEYIAKFNFSSIEKWRTISTSQLLSDTFVLVF